MCGICGGDGRIMNGEARCPSCHGSGRKSEDTGMRDVTKTKPSHHRQTNKAQVVEKQTWPSSIDGGILADEIKACGSISEDTMGPFFPAGPPVRLMGPGLAVSTHR